jgi:uncharacterized OB-fold protein
MTELSNDAPPIADGLFEIADGELVLVGSRCTGCGTVAFPSQASCPRCTSEDVEGHRLATSGTLWTWTTQGFRPKSPPYAGPEEFAEYAVGYVELGGEIRVEGLLTESDPQRLGIGMAMGVTAIVVPGATGEPRTTYAFTPLDPA